MKFSMVFTVKQKNWKCKKDVGSAYACLKVVIFFDCRKMWFRKKIGNTPDANFKRPNATRLLVSLEAGKRHQTSGIPAFYCSLKAKFSVFPNAARLDEIISSTRPVNAECFPISNELEYVCSFKKRHLRRMFLFLRPSTSRLVVFPLQQGTDFSSVPLDGSCPICSAQMRNRSII